MLYPDKEMKILITLKVGMEKIAGAAEIIQCGFTKQAERGDKFAGMIEIKGKALTARKLLDIGSLRLVRFKK